MTEEQARQIICPKYKAALLANPSREYYPADLNKLDDIKCDASECGMWRWSDAERSYQNDDGSWVGLIPTRGFCGLGGTP